MAKKKLKRSRGKKLAGAVRSATEAAVEIGQAAKALQESWDHVKKARQKGKKAARPLVRAGKRVARGGKKIAKKARKAISKRR